MRCPVCGHVSAVDDRFCSSCGEPLDDTGSITSILHRTSGTGSVPAVGEGIMPGLPANAAALVVFRGSEEGSEFILDHDLVSVGRSPEADVFLDDVTVSRLHAEFRRNADGWSLRDAGSLNGTYVNRKRVDDTPLTPGDEVQIGKFRFVFVIGE